MLRWYRRGEWLAARIPPPVAWFVCRVVGAVVYAFVPRLRRVLRDHQRRLVPGASSAVWGGNARRVVATVAMNYYDLFLLPRRPPEALQRYFALTGSENVEAARARGNGIIFIGPHLGNFNYVAAFAPMVCSPAVAVIEQLDDPEMHDYFRHLRGHPGLEIVTNGPQNIRTILRTLRANGAVMMLCDRDVGGVTDDVTFFEERTRLPAGPGIIARRTGAAIITGTAYRTGATAHFLALGSPIVLPESDGTPNERRAADTQAIAHVIEQMIRQAPDQWAVLQPVWPDLFVNEKRAAMTP